MLAEYAPGFLAYVAAIFMPGLGLGESLSLWGDPEGLGERIALAFGLGLVVDTTFFAVKAGVLNRISPISGRIDAITVYSLILAGSLLLGVSIARRRRFQFLLKPRQIDFVLIAILIAQAFLVFLYLQKFPIFPEFQSGDYSQHAKYAEQLLTGSRSFGYGGLLYYGVEYQLASALALVGGEGLITVRDTIAILVVLSPLLFYLTSSLLFDSKDGALASTAIYSISGTIWFVSVFNSGLYANFFGVLVSLLLVAIFCRLIKEKTTKMWLVFLLTLFTAYFSHYSTLTVLPSLLVIALVKYKREKSWIMAYFLPAIVPLAPIVIAAIAYPTLLGTLIGYITNGGGSVSGSTFLSSHLWFIPVLSYMAAEIQNDLGFLFLLILGICFAWSCVKSKNSLLLLPLIWFISVLVVAPFNIGAWRFSFEALVPLTLMGGYGLYVLFGKINPRLGRGLGVSKLIKPVIVLLLLSPIIYASWGQTILADSFSNATSTAQGQRDVYSAIYWLKTNTPPNSTYLSVTDWKMTYTNLIIGRPTFYKYFSDQNQTIQYAKEIGAKYVIVTRQVTLQLPQLPEFLPWDSFQNQSGFAQIFSNGDVRIYQLS